MLYFIFITFCHRTLDDIVTYFHSLITQIIYYIDNDINDLNKINLFLGFLFFLSKKNNVTALQGLFYSYLQWI